MKIISNADKMLIPEGKMYCPIVGTLGYVLSPDRRKTLLIQAGIFPIERRAPTNTKKMI